MSFGRGFSLKVRIDLLFGLLLFFGLAADLGRMIADARPRVHAESETMTRLSRDFVQAALTSLHDSPDPDARLRQMLGSLGPLRHVRIGFSESNDAAAAMLSVAEANARAAPDWFAGLIGVHPGVTLLPAVVGERQIGLVVIASDPSDEIDEVWTAASGLALMGGAVALAALLGASLLLGRTLKPLTDYGAALGLLRDGNFFARVKPAGSPEFVDIGAKVNALAEALECFSETNQQLIHRLMEVQDDERKAIAHELHDEIGPHLFAIRASAAVLAARLRDSGSEAQAETARTISSQIEALQGHNRRILRRLRPAALDDLGLAEALEILVKGWRETDPSVEVTLSLPGKLEECDPQQSLVLYRVVQEALTNIFRHARARCASVRVAYADSSDGAKNLAVEVRDDGIGLADARPGLGLTGMRERMRGLGGAFACGPAPEGGTVLEAVFPLRR
jgi:two-component system sensor histidine kinase UhpB